MDLYILSVIKFSLSLAKAYHAFSPKTKHAPENGACFVGLSLESELLGKVFVALLIFFREILQMLTPVGYHLEQSAS